MSTGKAGDTPIAHNDGLTPSLRSGGGLIARLAAIGATVALIAGFAMQLNPALVILTVGAAVSSFLALVRPGSGLLLFFAWVPAADLGKRLLWLPSSASPSWPEYQWILLLPDLILLATAARVGYDVVIARRTEYKFCWLDLPVGLFLVWSLLSILNPANTLYAALAGFKASSMYALLYFVVRMESGDLRKTMERLTTIVAAWAVVASAYALIQVAFGFRDFELEWLRGGLTALDTGGFTGGSSVDLYGVVRPFSTFASHEQLGWYLGFAILLLAALPRRRWFHWLALGLLSLALIRTFSRSAWIFTLVALLFAFLPTVKRGPRLLRLTIVVVVGLLAASFVLWTIGLPALSRDAGPPVPSEDAGPPVPSEDAGPPVPSEGEGLPAPSDGAGLPVPSEGEGLPAPSDGAGVPVPGESEGLPAPSDRAGLPVPSEGVGLPAPSEDAYIRRAVTLGSYERRIFTFWSLIEDPAWRTPLGNGIGSMWYAWRLGVPGTTNPTSQDVREHGPLGLAPGERVLSHVGTVDIVYELGILGLGIFVWIIASATARSLRCLRDQPEPGQRGLLIIMVATMLAVVVANSTVTTVLIHRPIAVAFWASLGVIGAVTERRALERTERERPRSGEASDPPKQAGEA